MWGASHRRPTAAIVIAGLAIAVAIGGTATAASRGGHNGNKIIKRHSLSGNRLKNDTVTGKQVKEKSLKAVPNALAVNGNTIVNVRKLVAKGTAVGTDATNAGAMILDLDCDADGEPTLSVSTPIDGAAIRATTVTAGNGAASTGDSQNTANNAVTVLSPSDSRGSVVVHLILPSGNFVDFDGIVDDTHTLGNFDGCLLEGNAIIG
jgi:hypothetical protein